MKNRLCTTASAYASTCAEVSVDEIASADKPMEAKSPATRRLRHSKPAGLEAYSGTFSSYETARLASTNSAQV